MEIKEEAKQIIEEWSKKTKLKVKYVNDGILIEPKLERKGAYVKELNALDYDLPIVNKAVVEFLVNKVPVEDTINNCHLLKEFQKIFRISSNYKFGWHNGKFLSDKTFRIFASKDLTDTYIGKCRSKESTIEKFGYTPEHCFIMNEDVNNKRTPAKLDKQWYIKLAKERLEDFGFEMFKKSSLF